MILFLMCLVGLVLIVIVMKPTASGIYPLKHFAPKYRALGAPPKIPKYLEYDKEHMSM